MPPQMRSPKSAYELLSEISAHLSAKICPTKATVFHMKQITSDFFAEQSEKNAKNKFTTQNRKLSVLFLRVFIILIF